MAPFVFAKRRWLGALATVLATSLVSAPAEEAAYFDLRLEGGRPVDLPKALRVSEGDEVTIRWTSDRPIELHVHGYNVTVAIVPDRSATMVFLAFATGRFPIEIHGGSAESNGPLIYLEVYPE